MSTSDANILPSHGIPAEVRGIIFDYGGTLDTRGDHWSHILYQGWQAAGIHAAEPTFRHCYVFAERELARERHILPGDDFRTLLLKKARLELQELHRIAPETLAETAGTQDTAAAVERAAATIADYCDNYARTCVNEARPVLEALSERYPMILVSNFYGNVDEVLRAYDLRKYFRGIIESAVVGVRKPNPTIFRLGVVALGLEPQQILVVGDSLRKDILPARSLGCHTAWIKGRGWTPDEDAATDPAQISGLDALTAGL